MREKKPKKILRLRPVVNKVSLRKPPGYNRYKLRTTQPAPGGVGHLHLTIQSR